MARILYFVRCEENKAARAAKFKNFVKVNSEEKHLSLTHKKYELESDLKKTTVLGLVQLSYIDILQDLLEIKRLAQRARGELEFFL